MKRRVEVRKDARVGEPCPGANSEASDNHSRSGSPCENRRREEADGGTHEGKRTHERETHDKRMHVATERHAIGQSPKNDRRGQGDPDPRAFLARAMEDEVYAQACDDRKRQERAERNGHDQPPRLRNLPIAGEEITIDCALEQHFDEHDPEPSGEHGACLDESYAEPERTEPASSLASSWSRCRRLRATLGLGHHAALYPASSRTAKAFRNRWAHKARPRFPGSSSSGSSSKRRRTSASRRSSQAGGHAGSR